MALKPKQIDGLRLRAEQLAEPINAWLLQDAAERIAKAGQMTSTAAYELYRARALGESEDALQRFLREQLKLSRREVRRLVRQAAEFSHDGDFERVRGRSKEAVGQYSESFLQTVQASAKLAEKDFTNLTRTLGMVDPFGQALPLQKAYRSSMDFAFGQVISGAADLNTAVRMATKKMADLGVRVIDYESGAHIGLEAAARRNLLSGLGQLDAEISQQNHDELGCNGWEISAHANSAPDHEPIQGRQYSDAEYAQLNGSLGRPIGTLNCGHVAMPIILGVNSPQYTPGQLEQFRAANAEGVSFEGRHYTGYEAAQKRNELERSIQRQKRRCLVSEAAGDQEKLLADKIRLTGLERNYSRFCKGTGQATRQQRLRADGFGRSKTKNVIEQQPIDGNYPVTMESIKRVQAVPSTVLTEDAQHRLAGAHKQLLAQVARKPLGTEAAECYTLDMQRLAPISYGVPGAGRIRVPDFDQPYILVHNHPNGSTFSAGDIRQLLNRENLRILTAAGNDGSVYTVEKVAGYNPQNAKAVLSEVFEKHPDWMGNAEAHADAVLEFLRERGKEVGLYYSTT